MQQFRGLFSANTFGNKFNLKDRLSVQQFNDFESLYETFFELPMISKGWIANHPNCNSKNLSTIYLCKSQKNIRQKKKRSFLETYVNVDRYSSPDNYQRLPWMFKVSGTAIFPSPSKTRFAVVSKLALDPKKSDKTQSVIEIYSDSQLTHTVIAPKETFGDIHTGSQLSGFSWSANEKYIAFIAERKQLKSSKNFFEDASHIKTFAELQKDDGKEEQKLNESEEEKEKREKKEKEEAEERIGHAYEFEETFGEQSNGAKNTSIFIFDVENNVIIDLDAYSDLIPSNIVLGEVIFCPDSQSVIAVAYDTYPRKLGIRYYNTRYDYLPLFNFV